MQINLQEDKKSKTEPNESKAKVQSDGIHDVQHTDDVSEPKARQIDSRVVDIKAMAETQETSLQQDGATEKIQLKENKKSETLITESIDLTLESHQSPDARNSNQDSFKAKSLDDVKKKENDLHEANPASNSISEITSIHSVTNQPKDGYEKRIFPLTNVESEFLNLNRFKPSY